MDVKHRRFYDFSDCVPRDRVSAGDEEALREYIGQSLVGGSEVQFCGPFGKRPVVYADYIASGRPLAFIEDFIRENVLPFYANTHNTNSITALQTTMFRHESRDIIRNAVNASDRDRVVFTGSGCTGAVHKLIRALGLDANSPAQNKQRVVVFVSGMEHHSNLLPWRDLGASVVHVKLNDVGQISLDDLRAQLSRFSSASERPPLLIGCFCAASNITGVLNDDLAITALLHKYGALSFWDYATAAPYVNIDMNPAVAEDNERLCAKDAIFFSGHKFVGGVQSPGILVAKAALFKGSESKPNGAGGGSVFFVREDQHRYLKDVEMREEGGTPAIVESIRAGMVFQLKEAVGSNFILKKEEELVERAKSKLKDVKNLHLLGNYDLPHLPILSFLVSHPKSGTYLHHNFLSAVLNDVFGIQARGGCACAGPYAQHLLGMTEELASRYEDILAEDERLDRVHLGRARSEHSSYEILRPGFVRLNLPWFLSDKELDFILDAIRLTAEEAWKLLPQYRFNNETGEWKHFKQLEYKERMWLGHISYASGKFSFTKKYDAPNERMDSEYVLEQAKNIFSESKKNASKWNLPDQTLLFPDGEAKALRWFLLPSEVKEQLLNEESSLTTLNRPFTIRTYPESKEVLSIYGSYYKGMVVSQDLIRVLKLEKVHEANLERHLQVRLKLSRETATEDMKPTAAGDSVKANAGACESNLCEIARERGPIPELTVASKWRPPTKDIFKPFLEAVEEFNMINDGDRVLVCLSGGKDSLTLLHTMKQLQYYLKNTHDLSFELGAVTVDPGSSAYDPRPLIPYLKDLGVPYLYEEQDIMAQALKADCTSICAFCSRLKRGRIYAAARRDGWNVLAMGQHLDDLAESFLMSVFHNGRLRTMKASYSVKEGDLRVIRPFAFVREKQLRNFAVSKKLPVISENCPACFESPKERQRTKELLAQQELLFPRLYWSLKSALMPVMRIDRTGVESILFGNKSKQPMPNEAFEEDEDEDEL